MENLVRSYLTRHYYVGISDIGNDGIYELSDTRRHKAPIYAERLVNELSIIFFLDAEIVKKIINDWAVWIKGDIDLEFYWKTIEAFFPLISNFVPNTFSNDLISVQPMDGPTGQLVYMDYIYSGNPSPNRNDMIRRLHEEQEDRIQREIHQINEERSRQSWFNRLY